MHGLLLCEECFLRVFRGNAFPHLFVLETLLEDFDFSFQFLHVAPGAA